MPALLARFLLTALAAGLPLTAGAEPLPRRESNVSIRNEVQLAIDKGLAHLQTAQRADGTWGRLGTTGFALMAFQRDPRGRYTGAERSPFLEKSYAALEQVFLSAKYPQTIKDFPWNAPPAVIALRDAPHRNTGPDQPSSAKAWVRGYESSWNGKPPEEPETRALFQTARERKELYLAPPPKPPSGSGLAAWIFSQVDGWGANKRPDAQFTAAVAELGRLYTLERNPGGEGVHRYYFWLAAALVALDTPELTDGDGRKVDVARELAEKLINAQNGDGSWSGVGEHWSEKDPALVTSYSLLALEAIYGLL